MKWWVLWVLAVVVVALLANEFRSIRREEAKRKREAQYESIAQSYSRELRLGLHSKSVEDYLGTKGATFITVTTNAVGDTGLVKIGEEDHPWLCSVQYVFVAFQFGPDTVRVDARANVASGAEVLKEISVLQQYGGCL